MDAGGVLLPAHALACGAPTLDVSGYDLVGVHETGVRHPDIPADVKVLTFTLDQWMCIYPSESATEEVHDQTVPYGQETHLHFGGESGGDVGTDHHVRPNPPRAGSYGGKINVVIVLPVPGDALYPSDSCNWHDVGAAFVAITNQIGGTYERWCYYTSGTPNWNSVGCGTDTTCNSGRMHDYVGAYQAHWVNDPNEIVVGVLEEMDNNGAAWLNDRYAVLAETVPCCAVNLWDDGVVMHEVGHAFGADHYPNDWGKWFCNDWPFESVMNYCDLGTGVKYFDSTNRNIVNNNWDAP